MIVFFYAPLGLSAAENRYLIMIDPAHGGQDRGVQVTDKVGEKDLTLAIALELKKELAKEKNFTIVLTRDADQTISCEERSKNIAKSKPNIFLSLHINAGFGKKSGGFELYYPGFRDYKDRKPPAKRGVKEPTSKYLHDSVRFAQIVQKNLDSIFPRKGRGLRQADTPILEGLTIPAVVVEIGFATNPEERKKLMSASGQSEIAKALAKSIKSFF